MIAHILIIITYLSLFNYFLFFIILKNHHKLIENTMAWIYLVIAGIFEMGWPLGFKLSQVTTNRFLWITVGVLSMAASGYFLWVAQKDIPIGTAYAVWTGIGAIGTFLIGIIFFKDPTNLLRIFSAGLIIIGVIGLKFAN